MNKFHPCRCRNVLLSLGLALGLLCIVPSGCLGQTMGTTSFSVQNRWQLSLPAPHSLLNAGPMVPLEPELTGLFLLNGEGVWLLGNGGRWKAGLSLAKVWGERLATHCAIGWEERDKSQAEQGNKLYRVLVEEATGAAPPPTVLPSVAWEQMMIQNLVDRSGLALFYLRFERDRFGLALGVQQPYGKNASEFGLLNSERQVTLQIHFGL